MRDQADDEQDQEHEEQNASDISRDQRDAAETEECRNQCDDQKYDGEAEHCASLFFTDNPSMHATHRWMKNARRGNPVPPFYNSPGSGTRRRQVSLWVQY